MANRALSPSLRILAAALLLFAAFKIGVHVGAYESWRMDSSAKARVLVGELKAIRGGKAEKLIPGKEIELDGAIAQALQFQDADRSWLFYPFAAYDHDGYLRAAAAYRRQFPSPTANLDFATSSGSKQEMEAYRAEVARRMVQLQQQYGG